MKRGFTLIELLVVIAIIGVLSSIVLASLNTARAKARDAERASDMNQFVSAVELYANDHSGTYPLVTSPGTGCGGSGVRAGYCLTDTAGLVPTYIPSLPHDPTMANSVNDYLYYPNPSYTQYILLRWSETKNNWCVPPSSSLYVGMGWDTAYPAC